MTGTRSAYQKVRRLAYTLPHLKPWQVGGRIWSRLKPRLGLNRLPAVPDGLRRVGVLRTPPQQHDPWNTAKALRQGTFCFLNAPRHLGQPVDWVATDAPLLWQFNLHYFHYLHLLAPQEQVELCRSWVAANPAGTPVSWHPYPTSLRIVNWCRAELEATDLLASLYQQTAHLYRNLETYIFGNHLLENARALVIAGAYFGDQGEAPQWLAKGLALYHQETAEQILPDGGHYERSPMYHALMLEGYLDVLNVLPEDHADAPWLIDTVRKMTDVLAAVTHPDDGLALFNDATHEIALSPAALRAYVNALLDHEPQPPDILPDTGYFTYRNPEVYLILDGGPVGPDHLMAHAHADIFSYELSVHGLRFIVDAGVYEYPAGAMRQYVRSTAAHNTVCIDDTDQVECWGSFRVARRDAPRDVTMTREGEAARFTGSYHGYAQLLGNDLMHQRTVEIDGAARSIQIHDHVAGQGVHQVETRVHLHPAVNVTVNDRQATLQRSDTVCILHSPYLPIRSEPSWYCPRFGTKEARTCLIIGGRTPLPTTLSYQLSW